MSWSSGLAIWTLTDESPKRKQVYCLVGNEPIAVCHERAQKVIEWGGEPYCQPLLPLNASDRHQYLIRHDWTPDKLKDFARFYNRHLWRYARLSEYRYAGRHSFAGMGL